MLITKHKALPKLLNCYCKKRIYLKLHEIALKHRRLPVLTRILREAMAVSTCHTLWDRYGERVAGTYIYGVSGSLSPSLPSLSGYHTSGWSHHCWRNTGQHSTTCRPAPPTPLTFRHPPQFLSRQGSSSDKSRRWFMLLLKNLCTMCRVLPVFRARTKSNVVDLKN